jgi:hypothetical protein
MQQPPATATTGAKPKTVSSTGMPAMWAITSVIPAETAAGPETDRGPPPRERGRAAPGPAACESPA